MQALPAPALYSKFDMALFIEQEAGQLSGNWQFATTLFRQEHIQRLVSAWIAMLEQIVEQGCQQPVHLYYGVRHSRDLCELERIQAHGERLADFRFTPVISDADPDWPGKRGYISEHFDSSELRDQDTDMYVCGPPPMVDSIRIWLQEQQLNRVQLYNERFTESNI